MFSCVSVLTVVLVYFIYVFSMQCKTASYVLNKFYSFP